MRQLKVSSRKAEGPQRDAWLILAEGLQALNEDDPDAAIDLGHKAMAKATQLGCPEGPAHVEHTAAVLWRPFGGPLAGHPGLDEHQQPEGGRSTGAHCAP